MGAVVELTDEEWGLVEHLFDPPVHRGVKGTIPRRDIVDAILWLARTGCQWRRPGTGSAIEHEPAQLVAQPLVVEHEIPNLKGELSTLPLALQAAGLLALVLSRSRPRRPDRVGRGTELVGRHMAHRRGLTGGVRCLPRGTGHLSGCCVRGEGGRAGLSPRDLTPRPGTPKVDRASRTVVLGPRLLEVVEHVLRAVSRPHRE